MKIKLSQSFLELLNEQVWHIAKYKPIAAKNFKNQLLENLKKDLTSPFGYKKSIHFNEDSIRDYTFKGFTIIYIIDVAQNEIIVFGFIKYKEKL